MRSKSEAAQSLYALRGAGDLDAVARYLKRIQTTGEPIDSELLGELILVFGDEPNSEYRLRLSRRPGKRRRRGTAEWADDVQMLVRVERKVRAGEKQMAVLKAEGISRASYFRKRDTLIPSREALDRYIARLESQEAEPGFWDT